MALTQSEGGEHCDGTPATQRKAYEYLWLLAPLCAGISVALTIYHVLTDDYALWCVWQGASFDVETLPNVWLLRGLSVGGALVAWFAASAILARGGGLRAPLLETSKAFAGFVSILILNTVDSYTGYGVMHWSVLATILSLGFFAAWLTVMAVGRGEGNAALAKKAATRKVIMVVALAALMYFAVSFTMGMLQYRAVRISCEDCAEFDEMLWRTLGGQFLASSRYGPCFLAKHVEFIHLLLLPFYIVWPGLPVLMLLQSAAVASGVIPLYKLAKRKLASPVVAALFCLAYLFYAPMQYADKRLIYGTYLPEVMAIPLLLWVLYFFEAGKMWRLAAASLLVAACKEDMVMPIAMIGVVLTFRGNWRWGLPIFVAATAWFFVSLMVVVPHFAGGESHTMDSYTVMGGSVRGVMSTIVHDPVYALKFFFAFERVDFLLMMLVPMGCLALFSPTMLLIFLPSLASNNLASWEPSSTIFYHYHISLVPLAVGGAVFGAANVMRIAAKMPGLWKQTASSRGRAAAIFCGVLVLVSAAGGDVVFGKFPLSLKFYNPKSPAHWRHIYVRSDRAKYFVEDVLPMIPQRAKVSASQFLATRFTRHAAAHVYPRGLEEADYVVLEADEPNQFSYSYNVSPVFDTPVIEGFALTSDKNGIYVFKRDTANTTDIAK